MFSVPCDEASKFACSLCRLATFARTGTGGHCWLRGKDKDKQQENGSCGSMVMSYVAESSFEYLLLFARRHQLVENRERHSSTGCSLSASPEIAVAR